MLSGEYQLPSAWGVLSANECGRIAEIHGVKRAVALDHGVVPRPVDDVPLILVVVIDAFAADGLDTDILVETQLGGENFEQGRYTAHVRTCS